MILIQYCWCFTLGTTSTRTVRFITYVGIQSPPNNQHMWLCVLWLLPNTFAWRRLRLTYQHLRYSTLTLYIFLPTHNNVKQGFEPWNGVWKGYFGAGIFKQSMWARNRVGIRVFVPSRQATQPGWIGSLKSILGHLKRLKIRSLIT
jgi:hypothetical protein